MLLSVLKHHQMIGLQVGDVGLLVGDSGPLFYFTKLRNFLSASLPAWPHASMLAVFWFLCGSTTCFSRLGASIGTTGKRLPLNKCCLLHLTFHGLSNHGIGDLSLLTVWPIPSAVTSPLLPDKDLASELLQAHSPTRRDLLWHWASLGIAMVSVTPSSCNRKPLIDRTFANIEATMGCSAQPTSTLGTWLLFN